MDRSDVINLIAVTQTQDDYGVWRKSETARKVFCAVESVTRQEFYEGGRAGLNPQYRITMFFADYHGEQVVEYKGKRYGVYRTYHAKTDELEIYVERKGGTNAERTNGGDSGTTSQEST